MVSWPELGTRVAVRYRRPAGSMPPLTDAVGHLLDITPLVRVQTKTGAIVQFASDDVVALRTLSDTPVRASEIRALEHAAALACPGIEQRWLDGWLLRAGVRERGDFVWLGLYRPSAEELAEVADAFGLHPLAVEDALKAHQRPKLERYGEVVFLTIKTLWYVDAADAVETGEISLFMGRDFVVTVRHGRGSQLAPARHLLEADERRLLTSGPAAAIYAVADHVVDGYLSVVAELTKDVDEVETSVFSTARTSDSERIYALSRYQPTQESQPLRVLGGEPGVPAPTANGPAAESTAVKEPS